MHRLGPVALALLVAPAAALAQDTTPQRPDAGVVQLPQVDVTAAREAAPTGTLGAPPPAFAGGQVATGARLGVLGNRPLLDTPFTVQSYTAGLMRNQQARTLADVLSNSAAVRLNSPRFSEREEFFIRGFPTFNSNFVAVNGQFGLASNLRNLVEPFERVELLQGPSAFLTGNPTGFVGGSINLVTKRATDQPLTDVTLQYGMNSVFGGNADIGRRFGPNGEWGVRVNGVVRGGQTPIDRLTEQVGLASLAADYRGERLRVALDGVYQSINTNAPQTLFLSLAPGIAVPRAPNPRRNIEQPWAFLDNMNFFGQARVEYDLAPAVTAFATGGYRNYRQDYFESIGTITSATGNVTAQPGIFPFRGDAWAGDAGLRGRFATGAVSHEVTAAAAFFYNVNEYPSRNIGAPILTNLYDPAVVPPRSSSFVNTGSHRSNDIYFASYALSDTMGFLDDRVLLTLGARLQRIEQRSYDSVTGRRTATYGEDALTPSVGLVVKPWQDVSFYANYIEGLGQGPVAPAAAVNVGEVFAPIRTRQVEIGAKAVFGRIATTLALFQITQPSSFTDPATRIFAMDGEQRNRGIELSAFGKPMEGLRVLASAAFIDAELVSTVGGTFNGKTAPGVPVAQLRLGAEYDLPWVRGMTLGGRVNFASGQYADQANTQRIPSWTTLDLHARYGFTVDRTPMTARLNVINATNNTYWQSAGRGFLSTGTPLTVLFALSASL